MTDAPRDDTFALHVFDALGTSGAPLPERLGGVVMVLVKHAPDGLVTLMTAGLARLPFDDGPPFELAVEVLPEQEGAGVVALRIVCDDAVQQRRRPPFERPWRNGSPFLTGTEISALVATTSRHGESFDRAERADGTHAGDVLTLRLLTDAEAAVVADAGMTELVARVGGVDALIDVERTSRVAATPSRPTARPVILSRLHAEHPPRWLALEDGMFQSTTGLETPEYMADSANHEIVSLDAYLARFPFAAAFAAVAQPGEAARFTDAEGGYVLEWAPAHVDGMELASAPPADTPMPASVLELAAGRATRMLWRNDLGGLAIAIDGTEPLVVPWSPPDALPVDDCPWS